MSTRAKLCIVAATAVSALPIELDMSAVEEQIAEAITEMRRYLVMRFVGATVTDDDGRVLRRSVWHGDNVWHFGPGGDEW